MSQINILIRPSSCLSLPPSAPSTKINNLLRHTLNTMEKRLERQERDKPAAGMPLGYHASDGVRSLRGQLFERFCGDMRTERQVSAQQKCCVGHLVGSATQQKRLRSNRRAWLRATSSVASVLMSLFLGSTGTEILFCAWRRK
jgi:hypothetical protein